MRYCKNLLTFLKSFLGPDLPAPCSYSSAVTYKDGQRILVLGCTENPEKIYELFVGDQDQLEWKTLDKELKYPRSNLVAMMIPDEFTYC